MTTDLYPRPFASERKAMWELNSAKLPLLLVEDARFGGHKVATLARIAKGTLVAEMSGEMRHMTHAEFEKRRNGPDTLALGQRRNQSFFLDLSCYCNEARFVSGASQAMID